MPAKPSGEVKTSTVRQKRKNGDTYVLERKIQYDPATKRNRVLSSRVVGKIPKGSEIQVPTRPKRTKSQGNSVKEGDSGIHTERISAKREHTGMMDIIAHVGSASGIDDALYRCTDIGTAQKIISLARYLMSTNGQTLPGIATWQYNHPIPYAHGIFEDTYHRLFDAVALDESLQQNFFRTRCGDVGKGSGIAYDSTTYSTFSENQIEARYGFNKAGDGLKTVKYLTLYSIGSRQPIAFTKVPGDVPDVLTIGNALEQLLALGMDRAELVTDNGYYSEANLADMLSGRFAFISLAQIRLKWVRLEVDSHREELLKVTSACPFDASTHGISVMLMHEFRRSRKYANKKTGAQAGDDEPFARRIYLHIYFNESRKADEDRKFEKSVLAVKTALEGGTPLEELDDAERKRAEKYLVIRTWGSKTVVSFNVKACEDAKKYHGFFALVANKEKDPHSALRKYRQREFIEDYFRASKQSADSMRTRVWDSDTLRGRMFVQFVALCYYEYYADQVRQIKVGLGKTNGCHGHDTKENLDIEKKLRSWLDNTPVYLQLQWFDAVETTEVSSELRARRWSTEVTARDALFLKLLGVNQ